MQCFSWLSHVDTRPSMLQQAFAMLKEKINSNETSQYHMCTVTLHGISIRSLVVVDSKDKSFIIGFKDLGFGHDDTSRRPNTITKEAIVFMTIGLTRRWKVPLCYVLTTGLSASNQVRLLKVVII